MLKYNAKECIGHYLGLKLPILGSIAMPRTVAETRSDPAVVREVIESVFECTPDEAKQAYNEFLGAGIEYLSQRHRDHWGVSLFADCLRLNVGWVECLVLHPGGLRVLVEKESAGTARLDRVSYHHAPGCDMTTVPLSELHRVLPTLAEAHYAALSIAAKSRPPRNIRNAHSVGVTAFLSQALRRPILNPSYSQSAESPILMQFEQQAFPEPYSEGGRATIVVNTSHQCRTEGPGDGRG
jgi:hypothetical protein